MGLTLVITVLLIWGIKETKTANNSARTEPECLPMRYLCSSLLIMSCRRA